MIKQFLHSIVALRRNIGSPPDRYKYLCCEDFILQNGREYVPNSDHVKYKPGRPRQCFANALHLAIRHNLIYCEGYAAGVIPVVHAWCIEPGSDLVIDVTWDNAYGYYGVQFDTDFAVATADRLGHYGLIDNWHEHWPLLRGDHEDWRRK